MTGAMLSVLKAAGADLDYEEQPAELALANDFDAGADELKLVGISVSPAHGTARIGDNKLIYTPADGYAG